MLKHFKNRLFKSNQPAPRRMEDEEPSYKPPSSNASLTPEEREEQHFRDWLANLDPDLRPYQLCENYPKIARQILALWGQPPQCNAYMDQLLIAKREGRQGFPPAVAQELLALGAYYKEKYSALIGMRSL
jgi:hypothetical protein